VGRKARREDMAGVSGSPIFAVLNPSGTPKEVPPTPLAERLETMDGKTIYCVSQHVGDADTFLRKIAETLPRMVPGAKAIFRRRTSAYMEDEPELWNEIKRDGAAFIYGCGA
jgi:hypothetical protein